MVQKRENVEQFYLKNERSDNDIPFLGTFTENQATISNLKCSPIMPVELNTISACINRKRKSVFSTLKVKPSFKKLKMEYLV